MAPPSFDHTPAEPETCRPRSLPYVLGLALLGGALLTLTIGCGDRSGQGDKVPAPPANPLGAGLRVRQVQAGGNVDRQVEVTATSVLAIDDFDETGDGKSRGTVYVQDYQSQEPLAGISLFSAIPVPASLRLSPNDVVDLEGTYAEVFQLGSFHFKEGFLPQLVTPQMRFRYEGVAPEPKEVDLADLEKFDDGRKWISMLVVVRDVFAASPLVVDQASGRASVTLTKKLPGSGLATAVTISNELIPLTAGAIKIGDQLTVTGVVTFFSSLHIAPRSGGDIVKTGGASPTGDQ